MPNRFDTKQVIDQFLIASEMKIKFAWMGIYFFVVYIFYNVIYYYEHNEEDRVSFEVFDWAPSPGKGCLWVFLILAFFVPGFTAFHVFVYRCVARAVRQGRVGGGGVALFAIGQAGPSFRVLCPCAPCEVFGVAIAKLWRGRWFFRGCANTLKGQKVPAASLAGVRTYVCWVHLSYLHLRRVSSVS